MTRFGCLPALPDALEELSMLKSIRTKMLSVFLVLSLMLAAADAGSVYALIHLGRSVQDLLDQNYRSIDACRLMIEALERANSGVLLAYAGQSQEGQTILHEAESLLDQGLEIAKGHITIPTGDPFEVDLESREAVREALSDDAPGKK
jgi:hypothetical protein